MTSAEIAELLAIQARYDAKPQSEKDEAKRVLVSNMRPRMAQHSYTEVEANVLMGLAIVGGIVVCAVVVIAFLALIGA